MILTNRKAIYNQKYQELFPIPHEQLQYTNKINNDIINVCINIILHIMTSYTPNNCP